MALFSQTKAFLIFNSWLQLVLDSHRWVPLPAVGFSTSSFGEESQEDITPPSNLMEHPPLAVFVNGTAFKLKRDLFYIIFPLFFSGFGKFYSSAGNGQYLLVLSHI